MSVLLIIGVAAVVAMEPPAKADSSETRLYENRLTRIASPRPILADHPRFVSAVKDVERFEAPSLVDDPHATLELRAWRFSYNARGIIEIANHLDGAKTAVVVVHPWGVDDGQGWITPEPAGAAFQCTPIKNQIALEHARTVIQPLLTRLRPRVAQVVYSLPGKEDPIRKKLYRSVRSVPAAADRTAGAAELRAKLQAFRYQGEPLPSAIPVDAARPTISYFQAFRGLDAGPRYDPKGFWELPIPVSSAITVDPRDLVIYDGEGYPLLRDYLQQHNITHIILAGYNTDMCVCSTTAGYKNLREDFDVFLVGDATLATFPANEMPAHATNAAVSFAALDLFITQSSWIEVARPRAAAAPEDQGPKR